MLGLKKAPMKKAGRKHSVTYRDFRVYGEGGKETLRAVNSLNCDCRDGVLKTGLGVTQYTMKSGANPTLAAVTAKVDGLFSIDLVDQLSAAVYSESLQMVTEDGKLWIYSESSKTFVGGAPIGAGASAGTAVDVSSQKPRSIFVGPTRSMLVEDGQVLGVALSSTTDAICVCGNRIFMGLKEFKLVFSSPEKAFVFTPDTTDGSGTLQLPFETGRVAALLTFEDKVYVFCERGIYRLHADGSAREFRLSALEYGGGKIFGKTVGAQGKGIFFLAEDGLYRLYGESVKRVCRHLPIYPKADGLRCNHGSFGGDYIVRYMDTNGKRRMLVVDSEGKDGYFTSNFEGLSEHNGKTLCRYGDTVGMLTTRGALPTGEVYAFTSEKVDFGGLGNKTLTALRFEGTGSFDCRVVVDGKTYEERLVFENGIAKWKKRLRGKVFQFGFVLSSGTEIRGMTAEVVTA